MVESSITILRLRLNASFCSARSFINSSRSSLYSLEFHRLPDFDDQRKPQEEKKKQDIRRRLHLPPREFSIMTFDIFVTSSIICLTDSCVSFLSLSSGMCFLIERKRDNCFARLRASSRHFSCLSKTWRVSAELSTQRHIRSTYSIQYIEGSQSALYGRVYLRSLSKRQPTQQKKTYVRHDIKVILENLDNAPHFSQFIKNGFLFSGK